MSDFLTLNGFAIPIAESVQQFDVVGDPVRRAIDGHALLGENRRLRRWTMRTPLIDHAEAEALRLLIIGKGHYWSFDATTIERTVYSSRGVRDASQLGTPAVTADSRYGANALEMNSGESVSWTGLDVNTSTKSTSMVWVKTTEGGGYEHHIRLSNGLRYVAGILEGAPVPNGMMTTTSTSFVLRYPSSGTSDVAVEFDDLVVLPFEITAAMALAFGTGILPFSELPVLLADGDFVNGESVLVQSDPAQLGMPITNAAGLRASISFSLMETLPLV